tara:strand:+ start:419 stop:547 length:129 start_codon:yes stop_codon:yes gene_type:complete
MNKKIYLLILLLIIIGSCGKKGDPVYKEKISKMHITQTKIIS